MADLRKRFGQLVGAHRRRKGLTQEQLAERADLSTDMITKIEIGASGARFPVIERLAEALEVDPAEFFTTDIPKGRLQRGAFSDLSYRLAGLSDPDLVWVYDLLDAALRPRGAPANAVPTGSEPSKTRARAKPRRLQGRRS